MAAKSSTFLLLIAGLFALLESSQRVLAGIDREPNAPTRREWLLTKAPLRCPPDHENVKGRCRLKMITDYGDYGDMRRRASRLDRCPPGEVLVDGVCEDKAVSDWELRREFIAKLIKHLCPRGYVFGTQGCVKDRSYYGRYKKKIPRSYQAFEDSRDLSDSSEEISYEEPY